MSNGTNQISLGSHVFLNQELIGPAASHQWNWRETILFQFSIFGLKIDVEASVNTGQLGGTGLRRLWTPSGESSAAKAGNHQRTPEYLLLEPEYLLPEPEYLLLEPEYLLHEPEYRLLEPETSCLNQNTSCLNQKTPFFYADTSCLN